MFDNTTLYRLPEQVTPEALTWMWSPPEALDTLMLVDGDQWDPAAQETAKRLIQALQLDQKQAAIAAIQNDQTIALATLHQLYKCNRIIALGLEPQQLMLQVAGNRHRVLHMEGVTLVFGYSLAEMNSKSTYKAALWNVLQSLYNLA